MSKYEVADNAAGEKEQLEETGQSTGRNVLAYWRSYIILLTPLVLLPFPIIWQSSIMRCAYMMAVMAVYWVTEALPLAVTSLIPVIAAPLLDIMPSSKVCHLYTNDTIMLFIGGLMVAVCVEHWNLHKRIALGVLLLVGSTPQWVMLGFMASTWFLSMWISNTATTAMMIPIVTTVVTEMRKGEESPDASLIDEEIDEGEIALENRGYAPDEEENSTVQAPESSKKVDQYVQISKMMSLSVCYAANCGGIATLTGTPPNLVLKGQLDVLFGDEHGISFSSWMAFGFPVSIISLLFGWMWLLVLFIGCRGTFLNCCKRKSGSAVKAIFRAEYKKLGRWSSAEITVLTLFIILALLWFFKSPGFPGWASIFEHPDPVDECKTIRYVSDATAAIGVAIILFMIPSQLPNCRDKYLKAPVPNLLNWEIITHKLPWNIVLLLGGGFALAESSKVSGLSAWVGQQLQALEVLPTPVIVLLISTIIACLTEVTSNTATASLMLGIVAELAKNLGLNPLILMLPTTVSASFAFMLPVATPPNAIVFAYGNIRIKDMMIAGIVMNIFCILLVTLGVNTWGMAYFHLDKFPAWANGTVAPINCTSRV
ncbi:Na(+)/citrate cotransporter-like isoform X2 [Lineus longissimus]